MVLGMGSLRGIHVKTENGSHITSVLNRSTQSKQINRFIGLGAVNPNELIDKLDMPTYS